MPLRSIISTAIFVLGMLAASEIAKPQTAQSPIAIEGHVIDATTSEPVIGATAIARLEGTQGGQAAVLTKQNGHFLLSVGGPGRYVISVSRPGFQPWIGPLAIVGESLALLDRVPKANLLSIRLKRFAVIAGNISDSNGSPVMGATVVLLRQRVTVTGVATVSVGRAATNDLGEYRFFGLSPGRYSICAYYRDGASAFGLRVTAKEDRTAATELAEYLDYGITCHPNAGDYSEAVPVQVRAGQVQSADIRLKMVTSVTVEGILDNLPESKSVSISLRPASQQFVGPSQSTTVHAESGRFDFKSVPPGSYVITGQLGSGSTALIVRSEVTVRTAPINIRIPLEPQPSFKGNVTYQGNLGTATPVVATQLWLDEITEGLRLPLPITKSGLFNIQSLPPGRYRISVASPSNLQVDHLSLDGTRLKSTILDIFKPITSIEIALTADLAAVKGTCEVKNGSLASQGLVLLINELDRTSSMTVLDSNGSFGIKALLPGTYRADCFLAVNSLEDITPEMYERTLRSGQRVTLDKNVTSQIPLLGTEMSGDN